MANLNASLLIAKTALLSTQKAINVTSHNITNANTEGYTRQRVDFEPLDAIDFGGLAFGTGVNIRNVERVYDDFKTVQLRNSYSQSSRYSAREGVVRGLESLVNDFEGGGLLTSIDGLFSAFSALASDPSSYAERSSLLSAATVLTDSFNNLDTNVRQNLSAITSELTAQVDTLNSYAEQVAELNRQISELETGRFKANDLRDSRDLLLDKISHMVDINTIERDTGVVDVFLSGGAYLVSGTITSPMALSLNGDYPVGYDLMSNNTAINDKLGGGSLKGLLEGSATYREAHEKLNLLAAAIVKEVNEVHQGGYALDGTTNNDFFNAPNVFTQANVNNSGSAAVTAASVTSLSALTLDDYQVRFADASNYLVVNTTSNSVVASGAYTSGNAITFDGLSVTITDTPTAPAAGDIFEVSVTKDAALNMGVALSDTDKIAAASTAAGVPGDNTNALALAALKDAQTIGSSTFTGYYVDIVSDVGIAVVESSNSSEAHGKIVEQLTAEKSAVSGVSIEEEAINLVKLQRAYEAAAKVLSTVDSMFQTILNLK